ncbi:MAG: hypothetical protein OEY01_10580 [Desulfobulbaceae bacterium]|nr:hypothetical protein [Desulfobulbaceae bacterium]HIJ79394.1 hypothetical protein [Deltaproteobacteria bacterium]
MATGSNKKEKGGKMFCCPEGNSDNRLSPGLIVAVLLVIGGVTLAVLHHAKDKPASPQSVVAAALNRAGGLQEWRPGMGPQPLLSKPAAFGNGLQWRHLYSCPTHGLAGTPFYGPHGVPHCPICKQKMMVNR